MINTASRLNTQNRQAFGSAYNLNPKTFERVPMAAKAELEGLDGIRTLIPGMSQSGRIEDARCLVSENGATTLILSKNAKQFTLISKNPENPEKEVHQVYDIEKTGSMRSSFADATADFFKKTAELVAASWSK